MGELVSKAPAPAAAVSSGSIPAVVALQNGVCVCVRVRVNGWFTRANPPHVTVRLTVNYNSKGNFETWQILIHIHMHMLHFMA